MLGKALALIATLQFAAMAAQATEPTTPQQDDHQTAAVPTVQAPRDRALLAHERNAARERVAIVCHGGQENIKPTRRWRVWDRRIGPSQIDRARRMAQRIRTGSITRTESQHLIHMELEARRILRSFRRDGFLSDPEREVLREAFGDAGQVIFYAHGGGRRVRPAITARINDLKLGTDEASELFDQFIRLAHVQRMLAGPPQAPRKRDALEAEYAQLAAQLYE